MECCECALCRIHSTSARLIIKNHQKAVHNLQAITQPNDDRQKMLTLLENSTSHQLSRGDWLAYRTARHHDKYHS
jgi:hypothetical protein